MRVLVCDDELDIRMLYRVAFEGQGVDVLEAVDGDDCVEVTRDAHPDLIVLDLYMPKRDGLSALAEIKRTWPDIPVVVVSAHASVEVMATGRQLGADACYQKPVFIDRVPELVARYRTAA